MTVSLHMSIYLAVYVSATAMTTLSAGEAKRSIVNVDTGEVQGQSFQYGMALLRAHPLRTHVHGFSISPNAVQFYTITRGSTFDVAGGLKLSPPLPWGTPDAPGPAVDWLLAYLHTLDDVDAWESDAFFISSTHNLLLRSPLGAGSTATVYSASPPNATGTADKPTHVVKVYANTPDAAVLLAHECGMLCVVRDALSEECAECLPPRPCPGTYGKLPYSGHYYLVMAGVGQLYAAETVPFSCGAAGDVLSVLQAAHTVRVVHLDVRPSNVVKLMRAMLIDFGFAVLVADEERARAVPFSGTIRYASPRVLASLLASLDEGRSEHLHVPHPWDDLHSWIRLCYALTNPYTRRTLSSLPADGVMSAVNVRALGAWWEQALGVGPWKALVDALPSMPAVDDDLHTWIHSDVYDRLRELVRDAVPRWRSVTDLY